MPIVYSQVRWINRESSGKAVNAILEKPF